MTPPFLSLQAAPPQQLTLQRRRTSHSSVTSQCRYSAKWGPEGKRSAGGCWEHIEDITVREAVWGRINTDGSEAKNMGSLRDESPGPGSPVPSLEQFKSAFKREDPDQRGPQSLTMPQKARGRWQMQLPREQTPKQGPTVPPSVDAMDCRHLR